MSGKVLTSIFDASVQLSSLQRYSMTKLVNPESVLEHQGSVAMMGVMLGIKLNSFGEDFDIGMIALKSSLMKLVLVIFQDLLNMQKIQ